MKLQAISSFTFRQKAEEKPQYTCMSCAKCSVITPIDGNNRGFCTFFARPIDADYNKCFNHSFYNEAQAYQSPSNLIQMMKDKEEKSA